jgi:hypothetical protein
MLALARQPAYTLWESNFTATPALSSLVNPVGTFLTAHATPHSKGAWATLIASTIHDSYGFWLRLTNSFGSATLTHCLMDIAIGASQENIIIPEFMCGWRGRADGGGNAGQWIPIFIPKGSKISARIQSVVASNPTLAEIVLCQGASSLPGQLFSGCNAYGTDAATSNGTIHTPHGTGSESEDANIGGTLTKNYGAVMLSSIHGSSTTTTNIAYHWELTIGGITICEWYTVNTTSEFCCTPFPCGPFYLNLPVGTQLQVQAEASGTAQDQYVAFHCFY